VLRSMVKEDPRRNTKNLFRRSPLLSRIWLAVHVLFARSSSRKLFFFKIDVTIERQKT